MTNSKISNNLIVFIIIGIVSSIIQAVFGFSSYSYNSGEIKFHFRFEVLIYAFICISQFVFLFLLMKNGKSVFLIISIIIYALFHFYSNISILNLLLASYYWNISILSDLLNLLDIVLFFTEIVPFIILIIGLIRGFKNKRLPQVCIWIALIGTAVSEVLSCFYNFNIVVIMIYRLPVIVSEISYLLFILFYLKCNYTSQVGKKKFTEIEELKQLKYKLDSGDITKEEYDEKRSTILKKI